MDPSTRLLLFCVPSLTWVTEGVRVFRCVCVCMCTYMPAMSIHAIAHPWRQSYCTKQSYQQLYIYISGKLRAELSCVETEYPFGFAPSKHQLSPPIIVVMSALLIQQGPEGPRLRWCTGSQCSPVCLERVWFLGELKSNLGQN